MKGLLFRKQPLHTSPTTGAKAVELSPAFLRAKAVELSPAFLRANVCELSHTFLRAMRASPHLHPKGESGAALLSSLGNLTSPPRRLERVESQNECSKPERFDELALAWFSDTIDVLLAKVNNAAPIDSRSKLERRARFVLFRCCFLKLQTFSFSTSSEKQ